MGKEGVFLCFREEVQAIEISSQQEEIITDKMFMREEHGHPAEELSEDTCSPYKSIKQAMPGYNLKKKVILDLIIKLVGEPVQP